MSAPEAARCVVDLLWYASESDTERQFLAQALPSLSWVGACEYLAVGNLDGGGWTVDADTGRIATPPSDLAAEALDRDGVAASGAWLALPLAESGARTTNEVFAIRLVSSNEAMIRGAAERLQQLAPALSRAWGTVRARRREVDHVARLKAILAIAQQWYAAQEMEPLLNSMAEAATSLLSADRASIFLWDRGGRALVGRPALGVEGNELRIPDDSGVVGQVVHSGQPRRVAHPLDQRDVDRRVDQRLGYTTRTLLCVPLRGRGGEVLGAFEVLNKRAGAFDDEDEAALVELAAHAAVAVENTHEREFLLTARRVTSDQASERARLIGDNPAIAALRSTIQRVADTELAVLVLGENGSGKEVVSQAIHYASRRREGPFVAVNCAAMPEALLESELFGHEKGAFTDAHAARQGKFELASGGTLFLDEIGDLSPGGQAKLLRVLEEKIVVRVGGSTPIHTDARVIAATNQDLSALVRDKRFRQDLFFRLNVVTLTLPPLRERADDILPLAEHFLREFCRKARRAPPRFSADARKRLETHSWPGNVRELRNLMERLAYLGTSERVDAADLAFVLAPAPAAESLVPSGLPLSEATDQFQIDYIQRAVAQQRGNMTDAAKSLGLHRSNLYRKMRQLGLETSGE